MYVRYHKVVSRVLGFSIVGPLHVTTVSRVLLFANNSVNIEMNIATIEMKQIVYIQRFNFIFFCSLPSSTRNSLLSF